MNVNTKYTRISAYTIASTQLITLLTAALLLFFHQVNGIYPVM